MTQKDKELLLKDLCARLPYGVRCSFGVDDAIYEVCGVNPSCCGASEIQATHIKNGINGDFTLNSCKLYLFPLSSMTEEQKKEYYSIIYHEVELHCERYYNVIDVDCYEELHDFYHKNHLDYRNLIGKGPALDATGLNIY